MEVPYQSLKNDTLMKVIESFVVREGTEYGEHDVPLAKKVEQVLAELKGGKIKLLYSEKEGSINLVTQETLQQYLSEQKSTDEYTES